MSDKYEGCEKVIKTVVRHVGGRLQEVQSIDYTACDTCVNYLCPIFRAANAHRKNLQRKAKEAGERPR